MLKLIPGGDNLEARAATVAKAEGQVAAIRAAIAKNDALAGELSQAVADGDDAAGAKLDKAIRDGERLAAQLRGATLVLDQAQRRMDEARALAAAEDRAAKIAALKKVAAKRLDHAKKVDALLTELASELRAMNALGEEIAAKATELWRVRPWRAWALGVWNGMAANDRLLRRMSAAGLGTFIPRITVAFSDTEIKSLADAEAETHAYYIPPDDDVGGGGQPPKKAA
jgi:hypothetical protein